MKRANRPLVSVVIPTRNRKKYGKADKEFYVTASRILELANRAAEIFESSKAEQKRQLLQFLLQNSTLDGKKVDFTLKKPFDAILTASKTEDWLPSPNRTRTF